MPESRLLANEFKLAVTTVGAAPGGIVPPGGETVSHAEVLTSVQVNWVEAKLVNAKLWLLVLKAPPTGPAEANPSAGVTPRGSGGNASALIRPNPTGVPHPVHRS